MTLKLSGLKGTNPLGFLAALGVLDVATRQRLPNERVPRLWWTDEIEPIAQLEGVDTIDELIRRIEIDRERWADSPTLKPIINGHLHDDVKVSTEVPDPADSTSADGRSELQIWIDQVLETGDDADIALLFALVAEGSTGRSSAEAKPSHLHFTAGQKRFLKMARTLQANVTTDDFSEALVGPWLFSSPLPVFDWDTSRGNRIYALRGLEPSKEKGLGTPGAEWLGLLGLRFFPVATRTIRGRAQLVTTGCTPGWKQGTFTWPLWRGNTGGDVPGLPATVVQSLVTDGSLANMRQKSREVLGVSRILQSPISRTDQGGYGSFGPPIEVASHTDFVDAMVL